jgi:DNA modification methylase
VSTKVIRGNCKEVLARGSSDAIDAIITDPPYELNFMGRSWDRSGIAFDVDMWRECHRVLKPGGHLLCFGGTRTFHRIAVAIEDAGFEIRDTICWLSSSAMPKSKNLHGEWRGWGTNLTSREQG